MWTWMESASTFSPALPASAAISAHADQKGLVDFVTDMQQWPTEIRMVHGEQKARMALTEVLKQYANFH